jgi:hypothetical protein
LEPVTFVRSPTFTNNDWSSTFRGSSPESRSARGRAGAARGGTPATASPMARMCSGVVPQQPPITLSQPLLAHSPTCAAIDSGVSSYSPKAFGRPALGWHEVWVSARRASSSMYGLSSFAPSAQLRPTASGRAWRMEL